MLLIPHTLHLGVFWLDGDCKLQFFEEGVKMNMKLMSVIFVVGVLASSGFGTAFGGFGSDDNNPYSFGQKEASHQKFRRCAR